MKLMSDALLVLVMCFLAVLLVEVYVFGLLILHKLAWLHDVLLPWCGHISAVLKGLEEK